MLDVARRVLVQARRAFGHRRERIADRRQRLPVDDDVVRGVDGDALGARDDRGDGLADVAHAIDRQRIVLATRAGGRVPAASLAGAGQRQGRAELADVVAGDDLEDARPPERRRRVDLLDARVSVRAAHERDVVHAGQGEIAHVARRSGDETRIFFAPDFRSHQSWGRHGQLEYLMRRRRSGLLALSLVALGLAACTVLSNVLNGDEIPNGRDAPIDHIVVLFLENRSFDHLFGTYPGADGIARYRGKQVDPAGRPYETLPQSWGRWISRATPSTATTTCGGNTGRASTGCRWAAGWRKARAAGRPWATSSAGRRPCSGASPTSSCSSTASSRGFMADPSRITSTSSPGGWRSGGRRPRSIVPRSPPTGRSRGTAR